MKNLWMSVKSFFKKNSKSIWKGLLFVLGGVLSILGLKSMADKKQIEKNEKSSEKASEEVEKADEDIKDAKEVVKDNEDVIKKYSKKVNK